MRKRICDNGFEARSGGLGLETILILNCLEIQGLLRFFRKGKSVSHAPSFPT